MGTSVLVQTSICPHPTSSDRVACLCAYWWPCPTLPMLRTQSGAPEKSTTTAVGRLRASSSVDCSLITCLEMGIFFGSPPSLVLLDKLPKKDHDKIFPRLDGKPLKESDFNSNNCGNANNVCYALFDQIKSKSLASTEETIGNLSGKKSAGDALCEQAQRFLKNRGIKKDVLNQKVSFYFSSCGSEWTPVSSTLNGRLAMEERLCCNGRKYSKC